MGGDKGGKGGKGYDGGKGGKGGKGDKGGKGGGGGGGKGGPPVSVPFKDVVPLKEAPSKQYISSFSFNDGAPKLSRERKDQKENDKIKSEVVQLMSSVPKPSQGKQGRGTDILTNMIDLKFNTNTTYYQYHSVLTPEVRQRKKHNKLIKKIISKNSTTQCVVASDIVYTNQEMKNSEFTYTPEGEDAEFEKRLCGEGGSFKLKMTRTTEITTTRIEQNLITIFSRLFTTLLDEDSDLQKINRTYFYMKELIPVPGMQKDLAPGLHMTLTPSSSGSGMSIQLDVTHKVLSRQTLFEELELSNRANHKKLAMKVRDTIVLTTYETRDKKKRSVHIDDVDLDKNENTVIPEIKMSLKQYYEKNYQLKIPSGQPLLIHYSTRKNKETGQPERVNEYYLPSVVRVTGLAPEISGSALRQKMTEMCAVKPNIRYQKINNMASKVLRAFNEKVGKAWGITAERGFVKVAARQLPQPTIQMSNGWEKSDYQWRFDIDKRDANPNPTTGCVVCDKSLANVLVVIPKGRGEGAWRDMQRPFERAVKHFANEHAAKVNVRTANIDGFSEKAVAAIITQYGTKPDCYVFLADRTDSAYDALKRYCTEKGIPSQVVRTDTMGDQRKVKSICNNIAGQIHAKRGNAIWRKKGCNHPDTMVVGIAFHHAGDGAEMRGVRQSVVGIACSRDPQMMRYSYGRTLVKPGETIAKGLMGPFRHGLSEYKTANKKAPKEIIVLREGGSEGEIPLIMMEEVKAIKDCLKEMGVEATLTFLLVIRNSHLRAVKFEPGDAKGTARLDGNSAPRPGTVIDAGVTNPSGMEFYVLAQQANIGSPCAIKYKCLHYGANGAPDADKYQGLVNDLASMYYNWTGPIALPAPIMYAQKEAKLSGDSLLEKGKLITPPQNHKLGNNAL